MKFLRSSYREILAVAAAASGLLILFRGGENLPTKRTAPAPKTELSTLETGSDLNAPEMDDPAVGAVAETLSREADGPPPADLKSNPHPTTTEQQISTADDSRHSPGERARALFALLPTLPEEALDEATQRAVEGLPDADYTAVALPLITNPETHGRILSVLFADLMERPDAIALPGLLTIARNPMHPFAAAAQDNLRFLAGQDFGHNWPRWEQQISQLLAAKKRP